MGKFEIKDYSEAEFIWKTGRLPNGDKVEMKDAFSTSMAPMLFPKVIETVVREAVEPLLVGTQLLTQLNYPGLGQSISIGSFGALTAFDIAEGQEFPIANLSYGGGTVTANIGKCGLALAITEEMIMYSQWDLMNMWLRKAGQALARHKEHKIFSMIRATGTPLFNNLYPTKSLYGVTHGRDIAGSANGSLILDDIFDGYAYLMMQGYTPNVLLIHPLAFSMFVKDPVLRAFALYNGGGSFFGNWTGNASTRAPWSNGSQGSMGIARGQSVVPGLTPDGSASPAGLTASGATSLSQLNTSAPELPSYWGNMPLQIVVSPAVYCDPRTKRSDVYLIDSRELGALVVGQDIQTNEWENPSAGIKMMKIWERYGIALFEEGKAVAKFANVKLVPNEIVLPAQATVSSLSTITASTAV